MNIPMSQLSDVCHGSTSVPAAEAVAWAVRRSEETKRTYCSK
jgi:hypothetical protein